jgi:hypothetical protein
LGTFSPFVFTFRLLVFRFLWLGRGCVLSFGTQTKSTKAFLQTYKPTHIRREILIMPTDY